MSIGVLSRDAPACHDGDPPCVAARAYAFAAAARADERRAARRVL
jgi:hypothetical protein